MYISQFCVKEHKSGRCSVLYNQLYSLWQIKGLTIHCKNAPIDINRQHILVYHYFATQLLPVVPFYIHVMITKLNIYIFCILIHIYWFYLILYNRLEERQQSKTSWKQINPSIQDYILSIKYHYILGMTIDCRIANRLNDISWWLLKKKKKQTVMK